MNRPIMHLFKHKDVKIDLMADGAAIIAVSVPAKAYESSPEFLFSALCSIAEAYIKNGGDTLAGTLQAIGENIEATESDEAIRRQLNDEARDWLLDCFPDEEEAIRNASLAEIQLAVERHYDGGIPAFIRASTGHNYSGWTWKILDLDRK